MSDGGGFFAGVTEPLGGVLELFRVVPRGLTQPGRGVRIVFELGDGQRLVKGHLMSGDLSDRDLVSGDVSGASAPSVGSAVVMSG